MITKKIHYCWFGGKAKPAEFYKMFDTWRKYFPDYTIKEWNEYNFNINMCAYTREAYNTGNFAHVSDVCRIYALYTEGGVYLDTDVEILASFDRFMNFKSFIGMEDSLIGTGIIGSEAGVEWLNAFLEYYECNHFINIWGHTVRTPNTKILTKKILPSLPIAIWPTIFQKDVFCGKNIVTGEIDLTCNTVSIHHFAASWRKKKTIKQKIKSIIYGIGIRYLKK